MSALEPELVAALLAARSDPATLEFDRVIDAAEAAGTLTAATARELRYWQRRSLDALAEHACLVVPAVLAAREASDAQARAAAAEARMSWAQARAVAGAAEITEVDDEFAERGSRRSGGTGLSVVSDDD